MHVRRELVPHVLAELVAGVLLDGLLHVLAEALVVLLGAGDADDGEPRRQEPPQHERVQRRHQLLVGQVAGRAEDHEGARIRGAPQRQALLERVDLLLLRLRRRGHCSGLLSRWPPKPFRIAERTRLPQSASPRDAKRSKSDDTSTGAGTPSSTAASTVHRPSPESLTRPAYSSRSGDACSACAVRSSSHEVTTEPRRQTSAIAATSSSYL